MATEVDNEWANEEAGDRGYLYATMLAKPVQGRNLFQRAARYIETLEAQLTTRSDAHLLRSHANLVAALKSYRESHIAGNGNGHACATDPKWAEYICRRCKQADAALTEAAAQKENGNG
jgi:hypothetical protein